MANKISIDDLSKAIRKSVEVYSKETSKKIHKATKKTMRKFVKISREKAPKDTGSFSTHISSTIEQNIFGDSKGIWYVKDPDYRLTHLLEHGHQLRNGGRVEGTHFVQKSLDEITDDYLKDLEEAVKDD